MATSFPGGLDSFTNPTSGDNLDDSVGGRTHSQMHRDENDALEAVQAELGTDPAGAYASVKARLAALDRNVFDAVAYGALVDGSTDDTAAWQAAIDACAAAGGGVVTSSKAGVSVIAGALQDTGGANAQLLLPDVHMLDDPQMGIEICGPWEQSACSSVVGAAVAPATGLVLKSTLASGTGSVLGGYGSGTSYENFTFLNLTLRNLTVRTVSNPTITGVDLRHVNSCTLAGVIVDTGQYDTTLSEPTTATSFGLRLPTLANGANVNLDKVSVFGFYNGIEHSEHASFDNVAVGGVKVAITATLAHHASHYGRILLGYYEIGLKFTGEHYIDVEQWDCEHAASGWYTTDYDVSDASNYGKGFIRWASVLQAVGPHNSFTKSGGSGISTSRVGDAIGSGGSLSVQDENGTAITGVTQLDFQGAGVTAASGTGEVVVTIPGSTDYVYRDRLVATAGNTALTLGATPVANSPLVWVNGTIKWAGTDYTIASNVITFGSGLAGSDVVLVQYHSAASSASASTLTTPGVNIVDDFNRADSTSTMGSTSTGAVAWVPNSGTWGISSNKAYRVTTGSATHYTLLQSGVADGTVSVKLSTSTGDTYLGLVVRGDNAGNDFMVQYDTFNHTLTLFRRTAGVNTSIGSGAATLTGSDVLSVVLAGSAITVKKNGSTIISATDSAWITQTKHGFWTYETQGRFDDFSVQP